VEAISAAITWVVGDASIPVIALVNTSVLASVCYGEAQSCFKKEAFETVSS
jgi:hypothetical protein